jgi:hypothetical protein
LETKTSLFFVLSSIAGVNNWYVSTLRTLDSFIRVLSLTHTLQPSILLIIWTDIFESSASFSWEIPNFFLLFFMFADKIFRNRIDPVIDLLRHQNYK